MKKFVCMMFFVTTFTWSLFCVKFPTIVPQANRWTEKFLQILKPCFSTNIGISDNTKYILIQHISSLDDSLILKINQDLVDLDSDHNNFEARNGALAGINHLWQIIPHVENKVKIKSQGEMHFWNNFSFDSIRKMKTFLRECRSVEEELKRLYSALKNCR